MEHIYSNADLELSQTPGNKRRCDSADVSGRSVCENNPPSSKDTLKIFLAALGILLLCALVVLCVLGVLYHSKGSSYEVLREQYSRAVERRSEQEHNSSETERQYEELKVKYRSTNEVISKCSETERQYEELKVKYSTAHEVISKCSETERQYEALKVKYSTAHEVISKCSECQKCSLSGEEWTRFGVKCYYFSTDKLNWMNSRDYCAGKGGHLVVITSRAEQDFVTSRITEHHWIGLNDLETEGKWMWVNKQTLTETIVTFWYQHENGQDEPDNWTGKDSSGEDCVSLGNKGGTLNKWFDDSCGYLKKYVCEK